MVWIDQSFPDRTIQSKQTGVRQEESRDSEPKTEQRSCIEWNLLEKDPDRRRGSQTYKITKTASSRLKKQVIF
ncbi:MAG TPA: hypothetical protein IAB26_02630 [Candidatus Limivivens merdigallinarum]|uniref:Uncharacterized protein n=1 Tax=Candidatus Limivivens merdigallinarum TaxID=2840859 RepID=A0A9D1D177_9FIRM|nr:hypothetical protein [Candidatus Limivivens merdigallinarum]